MNVPTKAQICSFGPVRPKKELNEGSLVYAGGEDWFIPIDIRIIRARTPLPQVSEELWALIEAEEDTNWG